MVFTVRLLDTDLPLSVRRMEAYVASGCGPLGARLAKVLVMVRAHIYPLLVLSLLPGPSLRSCQCASTAQACEECCDWQAMQELLQSAKCCLVVLTAVAHLAGQS